MALKGCVEPISPLHNKFVIHSFLYFQYLRLNNEQQRNFGECIYDLEILIFHESKTRKENFFCECEWLIKVNEIENKNSLDLLNI